MPLRDFDFPPQMSKGTDDIAGRFYLPCLKEAISYDRVTGYFSSAVFTLAWPALRGFIERPGRIRIICSPALSKKDVEGLELGHRAIDETELGSALLSELDGMLADERLKRPARALAGLVARGSVELRLAFLDTAAPAATKRIFHDKVGVFRDAAGTRVGFRGTMNETYLGLAADGNLDSIDIWPSWVGGRDEIRLLDAESRFARLWVDEMPHVTVLPFPEVVIRRLQDVAAEEPWELVVDQLAAEMAAASSGPRPRAQPPVRPHQRDALAAWEKAGRRGILEHATGSGKTQTALEAIRRALAAGESPLVVVPSEGLLRQWAKEIRQLLADLDPRVLLCGAGNNTWRREGLLRAWLRPEQLEARIVVTVLNTAASPEFQRRLGHGSNLFLVADEVHRLGGRQFRRTLDIDPASRLGLSATPRRAGDPVGTDVVFAYFGGIVDKYSLRDAIRDGYLTSYTYHPHFLNLTESERQAWSRVTAQIRRRYARLASAQAADTNDDERLRLLLIRRSAIAKQALAKPAFATRLLVEQFNRGDKWLVYCDSLTQLREVAGLVKAAGLPCIEYHSAMPGDESQTLTEFEVNGGIVVAIRCLDEGIDIPSASHALILASSRNPREFVQRRGRVLRKAPGKAVSHVHDALIVPTRASRAESPQDFDAGLWGELSRAMLFAVDAMNPEARAAIDRLCMELGVDLDEVDALGVEDDDDLDVRSDA